jgi:hypothetical protein
MPRGHRVGYLEKYFEFDTHWYPELLPVAAEGSSSGDVVVVVTALDENIQLSAANPRSRPP